jgi:hypothetical protein
MPFEIAVADKRAVTPAKAGVQYFFKTWISASAGMTAVGSIDWAQRIIAVIIS